MSSADLVFLQPPVPGPGDVALVFGEARGVTTAAAAATLPALALAASATYSSGNRAFVAATLPALALAAVGAQLPRHGVTVAATLPVLALAAAVARPDTNDAAAWVTLPALSGGALVELPDLNDVTVAVPQLPGITLAGLADGAPGTVFTLGTAQVALPGIALAAAAAFDVNNPALVYGGACAAHQTAQPMPALASAQHQTAQPMPALASAQHQTAQPVPALASAQHQAAQPMSALASAQHQAAQPMPALASAQHQEGRAAHAPVRAQHQEGARDRRLGQRPRHQQARAARATSGGRHQDTCRDRRGTIDSRHSGAKLRAQPFASGFGAAARADTMQRGRHQAAWAPRPGRWTAPPPPPPDPCYLPDANLLFRAPARGPFLLFVCERHGGVAPPAATLVIPVRSLYMVTNNIALARVSDGAPVPANGAAVQLDVDSWTFGFSASLPGAALPLVDQGTELLLTINGTSFRVLVDERERDRTFGRSDLVIHGRGRNALLDDGEAVRSYTNTLGMTAQQLAAEALTLNGVPMGWTVDWGLSDWLVPVGAWSAQGTPIAAVRQIAAAAGGYLQPHNTDARLLVLPRYPALPRDWASLTPDVELPSAIVQVEGIRWERRPGYNRVYVAGGDVGGVMGQVTVSGTAGDVAAQMVVDPLITHVDAARQRGLSILGGAGQKAHVRLKVPALPELGFVRPGQLVRYVDGATTHLGLVRSSGLEARFGTVWQTIGVETHVVQPF